MVKSFLYLKYQNAVYVLGPESLVLWTITSQHGCPKSVCYTDGMPRPSRPPSCPLTPTLHQSRMPASSTSKSLIKPVPSPYTALIRAPIISSDKLFQSFAIKNSWFLPDQAQAPPPLWSAPTPISKAWLNHAPGLSVHVTLTTQSTPSCRAARRSTQAPCTTVNVLEPCLKGKKKLVNFNNTFYLIRYTPNIVISTCN